MTKPHSSSKSARHQKAAPEISVVSPVYNEQENIPVLCERIISVLEAGERSWEIVFVNDGSADESLARLKEQAERNPRIKIVNLRRNFGQTAALMAAINHASGEVIIPMDSDLQNDPADIPRLLEKLDEGYDVVSGWRKDRKDASFSRVLPSRIANALISWISGVALHDYGCTLKAYRRDVLGNVRLYGEMHRFIPIYASWMGARVTEIEVNHHPRTHGTSKYGLERIFKVFLDLLVVKFLDNHLTKPIYVFGGFALVALALSFLSGAYALYLKIFEGVSFILTPLPLLVVMTFLAGITSILMGVIAEILVRTYFESQGADVYSVRETINFEPDSTEDP